MPARICAISEGEFQGDDCEGVIIPAFAKLVEVATSLSRSRSKTSSPLSMRAFAVAKPCSPPPIITICFFIQFNWSGQQDLNLRPPAPKAGALPGCAMPRKDEDYTFLEVLCTKKTRQAPGFFTKESYIVSFKPTENILPLGS